VRIRAGPPKNLLRIFRKIRSDILAGPRVRRYLVHATGELLLVVVGVVIALQISNWNEERLEQKQIRASIRQAELLADYLRDRDIDQMDEAERFFLTTHIVI